MSLLKELGFNDALCERHAGMPRANGTHVDFRAKTLYLDIEHDDACTVTGLLGELVDVGFNENLEIALCRGGSRKLTRGQTGRRKVNIERARESLVNLFKGGIEIQTIDYDLRVREGGNVVVFTPGYCTFKDKRDGITLRRRKVDEVKATQGEQ